MRSIIQPFQCSLWSWTCNIAVVFLTFLVLVRNIESVICTTTNPNYLHDVNARNYEQHEEQDLRSLQQSSQYYYTTNDLGSKGNYDVTLGNPLRGLASDPYMDDAYQKSKINFTLEVFYYPFSKVTTNVNTYDWTDFDALLNRIASRNNHAIPRFYIDYPGNPLALPTSLISTVKLYTDGATGYVSPYYNDTILVTAMKNFIYALAGRYDGDRRLAAIQMGLLGMWGEWHVGDYGFLLPDSIRIQVLNWYDDAFSKTPIQTRYPRTEADKRSIGYYDDSFTYYTLDGVWDGFTPNTGFYFYPTLVSLNLQDFWKRSIMGGEVRPENVGTVFESTYPAGTKNHQDFYYCSQYTHSTYNKVGGVIGDYLNTGASEYGKANWNSARMGYAFEIIQVAAKVTSTSGYINIDIIMQNTGIAPFYYPLAVYLDCTGLSWPLYLGGVETIIEQYQNKTFSFYNIPATSTCLNTISFGLDSYMIYPGRPIKFAQGDGSVKVQVPLPPTTTPVTQPQPKPTTSAPVAPPPTTTVPKATVSLALVETNSLKEYTLSNGMTADLAILGSASVTIVARPSVTQNIRIDFEWNDSAIGIQKRTETVPPYALAGDLNNQLYPSDYLSTDGPKNVTARVVSTTTGTILVSSKILFNIINTIDIKFILVDPNSKKDLSSLQSGNIVDIGKVGSQLSLRAEL